MKKGLTVGLIIFFLLIVGFFIWAFGFSSKDSLDDDKVEQSDSKPEPALTLEQDKKSEQEKVEKNKETDDKDQKDKDRKSTRLNSSHVSISYAVFCLKKKNNK